MSAYKEQYEELKQKYRAQDSRVALRESLPHGDEVQRHEDLEKARMLRESGGQTSEQSADQETASVASTPVRMASLAAVQEEESRLEVSEDPVESIEPVEEEEASDTHSDGQSEDYGDSNGDGEDEPTRTKPSSGEASSEPKSSTVKNEAIKTAISVKARLPPCTIGAVELLTFFPRHDQWPEAALRLFRNNWKSADIAKIVLHARGTLSKVALKRKRDALKQSVIVNGKAFFKLDKFAPTTHSHLMTAVTSYDASGYEPRDSISSQLIDAKLIDIANGVVNWPTGEDRGIVTQAIDHAHRHGFGQYIAADIPLLAQQMSFTTPSEASRDDWDQRALQRVQQIPNP